VEKVATPGGGKFEQRVRLGEKGVCQSTNDATDELNTTTVEFKRSNITTAPR
jgi:hypothetical protein